RHALTLYETRHSNATRSRYAELPAGAALRSLDKSVPGDDCGLDLSALFHHRFEHLRQSRERNFPGDVVRCLDLFFRNQGERLAHGLRRMMERGFQRDLGIVQALGVELHLGSLRASAE